MTQPLLFDDVATFPLFAGTPVPAEPATFQPAEEWRQIPMDTTRKPGEMPATYVTAVVPSMGKDADTYSVFVWNAERNRYDLAASELTKPAALSLARSHS